MGMYPSLTDGMISLSRWCLQKALWHRSHTPTSFCRWIV